MNLKNRFLKLLNKYSSDYEYAEILWTELHGKYSDHSRHYHDLGHLESMFKELDEVSDSVGDLDAILFSIFYHDIIYKSTKSNNEHRSAMLFKERISKTTFSDIEKVMSQIAATKKHELSEDASTNILLDIDLSVLGKEDYIYNHYASNVREEYKIYPDLLYKPGRRKVLRHFLSQNSIYKTDYFRDKYEEKARENINRELASL